PKIRTPRNGSSVRSLSRYASVHVPGVHTHWYKVPSRRPGTSLMTSTALLLPWPLRVRASDFGPVALPLPELANEPCGLFQSPRPKGCVWSLVAGILVAALDEVDSVDVVVLPETAVDPGEIDDLEGLLSRSQVTGLIAGVREPPAQPGQFVGNWVHI